MEVCGFQGGEEGVEIRLCEGEEVVVNDERQYGSQENHGPQLRFPACELRFSKRAIT